MKPTNLKRRPPLLAAMYFAAGLTFGCGDLADSSATPPPLASVRGTLDLAPGIAAPQGDIRVAVQWKLPLDGPEPARVDAGPCALDPSRVPDDAPRIWGGELDPEGLGYHQSRHAFAAQQIAVRSQFPAKFTLTLSEPPGREVLHAPLEYFKPNSKLADGQLVVYRDGNGNGELDPSTFERRSPDLLLSSSASPLTPSYKDKMPPLSIVYMDRAPVLDERTTSDLDSADLEYYAHAYDHLEPGYNLVNEDAEAERPERLPDDAAISLDLNPTPYAQLYLCDAVCHRPDSAECPKDPRELPAADSSSLDVIENDFGSSWYAFEDERNQAFTASCEDTQGQRYFRHTRSEFDGGCVVRVRDCAYWVDKLPPDTSVPCKSYQSGAGSPPPYAIVN